MKLKNLFIQQFMVLLAMLGGAGCSHKVIGSPERHIAALTCESIFFDVGPSSGGRRSGLNYDDVKELIAKNRFQEAAWLLRQIGDVPRSLEMEKTIAANLSNMPIAGIKTFETLTDTVSEVYLVTFENGLKGIFKPHPKFWKRKKTYNSPIANPDSEVVSYQMSRELQLNLVPVTVLREIDGMSGSLQAFVDFQTKFDYTGSEIREPQLRKRLFDLVYAPGDIQKIEMKLFDFLTYNTDRNDFNSNQWMFGKKLKESMNPGEGSGLVGFDNGAAFQSQLSAKGNTMPTFPSEMFIRDISKHRDFFTNLRVRLTDVRIRELMQNHYPENVIQETIKRRQVLLKFYETQQ